jgi:hypothetical protein
MNSTVSKGTTLLPGFDNVEAHQEGPMLYLSAKPVWATGRVVARFNRNEYDCDPSFIYDVNRWAVRNGGVRIPQ